MAIATKRQRTFSDLDLNFTAHPVTGDVARLYDENAIKRSVRNLLQTNNFERPFHSEIGSQIRALLFEPASPVLNTMLKRVISDTITTFEPRVVVNSVTVSSNSDNNSVNVTLVFTIVNTVNPVTMNVVLQRTR
jgi:phage baseplate assembly protein W